nr:ankyrin repeat domain-containing protein [Wolbachia endosymbiont of Ctenocephalides felis wCfeT]
MAAYGGGEEVVKCLLEGGADIHATDKYGSTPLHFAAEEDNEEAVELLLKAGANVHLVDN